MKLKVMLILECTEEWFNNFNPLNAELNPICHLLALVAHHILHVSRIKVNEVPSSGSEQGQVVGTHDYSVECSGFIMCGTFFDYPRNCAFLKDYFRELVVAYLSKLIWRWGETTA
jgi:hypothetical protein